MADDVKIPVRAFDGYSKVFGDVGKRIKNLTSAAGKFGGAMRGMIPGVSLGFAGLTAGAFAAGKSVLDAAAEFERMTSVLETTEGSSAKAKAAMAWVAEFAKRTPFEIGQVSDAFTQLRAFGLDPTHGLLENIGNAAAAMGMDVSEAVTVAARAMTGENEGLKRFGITAKRVGEFTVYQWTKNGKVMRRAAQSDSRAQIQAVLESIWSDRYGGAMDRLSHTWGGMWSNLMDTVTAFKLRIANAGIFDRLKGALQSALDAFARWEKDGTLDRIANAISGELVTAFEDLVAWLKKVDWQKFRSDVHDVVNAAGWLVDKMGGVKGVLVAVAAIMVGPALLATVQLGAAMVSLASGVAKASGALKTMEAVKFFNARNLSWLTLFAPELLLVAAAFAAVGAAIYQLVKNWDALKAIGKDWVSDIDEALTNAGPIGKENLRQERAARKRTRDEQEAAQWSTRRPTGAAGQPAMSSTRPVTGTSRTLTNNAHVTIDMSGVPRGATVRATDDEGLLSLNVGARP